MKRGKYIIRSLIVFALMVLTNYSIAQIPEKISYQSVIRNNSGDLIKSSSVGIKISIIQGSATGSAVYIETHTTSTNSNGLVSLLIGTGSVVSGSFAEIDWSKTPYFIKEEIDPAGGTNYSLIKTSEIMSIPYALYAKTAENEKQGLGNVLTLGNNADTIQIKDLADPTENQDVATKAYSYKKLKQLLTALYSSESLSYADLYTAGLSPKDLFDMGATVNYLFNLGVGVGTMEQEGIPSSALSTGELIGTVTDNAGKSYKWVRIANQYWMSENLAWLPSVNVPDTKNSDGTGYYVYGYSGTDVNAAKATDNYQKYGVLYNWKAASNACPTSWRLPSDADWKKLEMAIGMSLADVDSPGVRGTNEGQKLKSTTGWPKEENDTDQYGFSALPSGVVFLNFYINMGEIAYYWSSTSDDQFALSRNLLSKVSTIDKSLMHKDLGFGVRCVMDYVPVVVTGN